MRIVNKKALQNYQILEKIEAGISLIGAEIKSIRARRLNLGQSFVRIRNSEAYLVSAHIPAWSGEAKFGYNPQRDRKLLLHKSQIDYLIGKTSGTKLTIVPTAVYIKGNLAKVEIGLSRPKRKFEKKEALKRRDIEREMEKELREKV